MLSCADLVVRWGSVTAVDGVALSVGPGEMVALVGPNGAGKTSLIQALAGMARPASGRVSVEGRLGYVPEGRSLFAGLTVEDNLALGAWRGRRSRDPGRVYAMLPTLAPLARRRAGALSGGQQQMAAIGRALMADPEVLLIDELSLGLAPVAIAEIVASLKQLHTALGLAVLLVEQNARLALALCERAYVLENGRIAAEGRSGDLAQSDQIRSAYFGPSPQAAAQTGKGGAA